MPTPDRSRPSRSARRGEAPVRPTFKENVWYWVKAIVAILIVRAFIAEPYRIPSESMEDTLLVGDFLIVSKLHWGPRTPETIGIPVTGIYLPGLRFPQVRLPGFAEPERGDVVVFNYPEAGQDRLDLGMGQDDGQPSGPPGARELADVAEGLLQNRVVEKEDGGEGLILGRRGHVAFFGEVCEEGHDLGFGERLGMAGPALVVAVEETEALDPGDVGALGADGIMPDAAGGPDRVEQGRAGRCRHWDFAARCRINTRLERKPLTRNGWHRSLCALCDMALRFYPAPRRPILVGRRVRPAGRRLASAGVPASGGRAGSFLAVGIAREAPEAGVPVGPRSAPRPVRTAQPGAAGGPRASVPSEVWGAVDRYTSSHPPAAHGR